MNRQKFLTVRNVICAFALLSLCAFSTFYLRAQTSGETNDRTPQQAEGQAEADAAHERSREQQAQALEGTWTVVLTTPQGEFTAYNSFARGGVFIGTDRVKGFSAGANPQHGVWEHRGGNRFALSFKEDLLDAAGKFSGVFTADAVIRLTGKDSFTGVTRGKVYDTNGTLLLDLPCVPVRGERMHVEPLPQSCGR